MKILYIYISAILLSGCISAQSENFMNKSIFQSIRVGNGGRASITDPQIEYGGIKLINKSQRTFPPPKEAHSVGDFIIEGADITITKSAIIKWKSDTEEYVV